MRSAPGRGARLRALGGLADHGQDRALDRLDDGGVGHARRLLQRGGEVRGEERLFAGKPVREAAQDLREDDAGVAARAHQRATRQRLGDARRRGLGRVGDALRRRAQRQGHVLPRVAVGNGKDVEGVNGGAMLLQPGVAGLDGAFEVLPVEDADVSRAWARQARKEVSCHTCRSGRVAPARPPYTKPSTLIALTQARAHDATPLSRFQCVSLTRSPCTLTLTCTTRSPSVRSTANLTLAMMLCAMVVMRSPCSSTT